MGGAINLGLARRWAQAASEAAAAAYLRCTRMETPKRHRLICGDSCEILKSEPDCSFDALVTDPPAGISFMGKKWDQDHGGRDAWVKIFSVIFRECLRVLKPGAHGLVWALPRTSHWTATALEDAGFEIRDVGVHLFGQGFPKSLDVSKALDKAAGADRKVVEFRTGPKPGTHGGSGRYGHGEDRSVTDPATDEAKRWEGFGTGLKPAAEHWILVRKPLEGTVAANVRKHGTGALNIDGCRIGTERITQRQKDLSVYHGNKFGAGMETPRLTGVTTTTIGRWPANLTLDEEAAALLDEQSGQLAAGVAVGGRGNASSIYSNQIARRDKAHDHGYADSGGASRFFYVAKASKKDRGEGNKHPTVKSTKLMAYLCRLITPAGGIILDPFMGSGSTLVAALEEGFSAVGIERDPESFATAARRVAEAEKESTTEKPEGKILKFSNK